MNPDELESYKGVLVAQISRLEVLNNSLDKHIDELEDEQIDDHLEKVESYRTMADYYVSLCEKRLREKTVVINSEEKVPIKLPTFTLPSFSGDVLNWNNVHEAFVVGIDKRNINLIEKMQYLKSCLKGESLLILDSFPLSDYAVALQLLTNRYGSKRRRVPAQIRTLVSMPGFDCKSSSFLGPSLDSGSDRSFIRSTILPNIKHKKINETRLTI